MPPSPKTPRIKWWWLLRPSDWAAVGLFLGVGGVGAASIVGFTNSEQKRATNPPDREEIDKPGRFSGQFPWKEEEYKKLQTKPLTLDEMEWQIHDRERQKEEYIKRHGTGDRYRKVSSSK